MNTHNMFSWKVRKIFSHYPILSGAMPELLILTSDQVLLTCLKTVGIQERQTVTDATQMPHSDLGLHCLPIPACWVNSSFLSFNLNFHLLYLLHFI